METNSEVKLEIDYTKVNDDIMDESELALWYLDHPAKTYTEEPSEDANDPLNTLSEIQSLGPIPRRRNYVHEGYKDPAIEEWEEELTEMIYKKGNNLCCKLCDYKHHRRGYVLNHVETYHPPKNFPSYKCLKCGDVVASRHSFQSHILKIHSNDPLVTVHKTSNNIVTSDPNINDERKPHFTLNSNGELVKIDANIFEDTMNVESKLKENRQNNIEEHLKTPEMKECEEALSKMAYRLNKTWNCKNCDYTHHRKGYVMNHIESQHAPENFSGYKCKKCYSRIKSRMSFLVHVTKCHKGNDVKLKESNSFEKPQIVFKSLSNNAPNKSLKLKNQSVPADRENKSLLPKSLPETTNKMFVSKRIPEYENYVTTKIASRPENKETFRCDFCKHNFKERPYWVEHMKRAHSKNMEAWRNNIQNVCNKCGYRCAKSYDLKFHMRKFHETLPVKFSHSKVPVASFFLPPVKQKSVHKHPDPRICQKCGGGFLDEESYAKHMTDVEGVDIFKKGNSFKCEFCAYSFKYAATWKDHSEICRKLLNSLKCVACLSKFKNTSALKAHIERCPSYKWLKISNSKIHDVRESVAPEGSKAVKDDEGFIKTATKLKHEEETTGNSNQLTLDETCSTLLDLLENVAAKDENEGSENKNISDNSSTEASYLEPLTQSDSKAETNEDSPMELDSYSIKQEETQSIVAELVLCTPVEAKGTQMEYQSFACNICTEHFSTGDSLGKHLLQHLQKSFKCKQCSKTFTNIVQVKAHEQYHANSKQEENRSISPKIQS